MKVAVTGPIPVFIINLKTRPDRKLHSEKEFTGRTEFRPVIVEAFTDAKGFRGLWRTVKYILTNLLPSENDFVLICQDDHQFTENYSPELLRQCITGAIEKDADILLGGVSWFQTAIKSSGNLYWVEKFSGLQFLIIFRKFFPVLLRSELDGYDACDYRVSALTNKKWLIFPFISVQCDFGYSDVTVKNNKPQIVAQLFQNSAKSLAILSKLSDHFNKIASNPLYSAILPEEVSIPTFVINLPERKDRLLHITKQFAGRDEFDLSIVPGFRNEIPAIGLWETIRHIISIASANDDDVIIICEDDHEFTRHYSKTLLINSIVQFQSVADLIVGGPSGGIDHILPVTNEICWVNTFFGAQFLVVYRKMFSAILETPFSEKVTADGILSEIARNKLAFYPFISIQIDFGYSDVNPSIRLRRPIGIVYRQVDEQFKRAMQIHNKKAHR